MEPRPNMYSHGGLLRRFAPMIVASIVAIAVACVPSGDTKPLPIVGAAILTVVLLIGALRLPWERLPVGFQVALPLGYLGVVALLRESQGGDVGFAVMALLPIVWVALVGRPRDLAYVLGGTALMVVLPPLVIGAPAYPAAEWRPALLLAAVGAAVGAVVRLLARERADRERLLAISERRHAEVLAGVREVVFQTDAVGNWTYLNPAWTAVTGYSIDETIGRPFLQFVHADDRDRHLAMFDDLIAEGFELCIGRVRYVTKTGGVVWLEVSSRAVFDVDGAVLGAAGTFTDVTERLWAEDRFRQVFVQAPSGLALVALDGAITMANPAMCALVGYTAEELASMRFHDITHPDDLEMNLNLLSETIANSGTSYTFEKRYIHALGHPVWVGVHATVLRDASGEATSIVAHVQDITERRIFNDELRRLADEDPLTGLLNRRSFERDLEIHAQQGNRYGATGAVLLLDLDGFKQVNDRHGHHAGDEVLTSIAVILRERLRDSDSIARIGGDEFAVLLPRSDEQEARAVGESLIASIGGASLRATDPDARTTVSIGVAMFTGRDDSAEEMLVRSDLAMYRAKDAGRNRFEIFEETRDGGPVSVSRRTWIDRIETAIVRDGLVLEAQPIVGLGTGEVELHELLVRIRGDDGELIPPGAFLGVAERFDLIQPIDRWVASQAIALLQAQNAAPARPSVTVNLSARSLADPKLLPLIETELARSDVDPQRLIFEITETTAITDIQLARRFAEELRGLGCRLALDDFGAGFGTFNYLKHLPFDFIKIDGEFVRGCVDSRVDQVLIRSVVSIAQGLGKTTIGEFVTGPDVEGILRSCGVDMAQGFFVGRPCSIDEAFRMELPPAFVGPGS